METLPTITLFYTGVLSLMAIVLGLSAGTIRGKAGISIGDGGMPALHAAMRRHGNFIEWVPLVLLLMMVAEGNGAGTLWLHISGVLLLAGRLIQPFGLRADNAAHPLRIVGNSASLLATLNVMAAIFATSITL